jgi:hypothetical protein
MKRPLWLALLLALSLALGMALACSGGDDDDDDDSGGECVLEDICKFQVNECDFGGWDSVEQCIEEGENWSEENCSDPEAAGECFCDCYTDNASDCEGFSMCSAVCVAEFCS